MTDAEADAALEERELDPGSDAGGDGESGYAPPGLDAEEPGKRKSGEIAEGGGENDADDGEAKRSARVAQGVEGGRVEATERGSEQADGGAGQNSPDVDDVGVLELAGLIDSGDDDVAESEKAGDGRDDEEGDLAKAAVEAGAENAGDFVGAADSAAHHG